jgi:hypothetical protein
MVSRFDEPLDADTNRPPHNFAQGPCTMGPIDPGAEIESMHVWVFQAAPGLRAAATGRAGVHVQHGDAKPPFRNHWMIRTELEPGSDAFSADHKATALAMAVVRLPGNGGTTVEQWQQELKVKT